MMDVHSILVACDGPVVKYIDGEAFTFHGSHQETKLRWVLVGGGRNESITKSAPILEIRKTIFQSID